MNMAKKTLWLVVAALIAFGCAEERPAIDRVQPYALQKSLFVGEDLADPADNPEFWTQGTLIDVGGYGAAQDGLFVSTYAQSMSRMKWQITEDTLLGRLAYERIEGTDGRGVGPATNDGTVVVAFRIEKHFDIVHAYNPTTGEKLNIIEENDRDRPWYQREYMRVDWSKNLNTDAYDFDTLSLLGVFGGITYEPLAMDVTGQWDLVAEAGGDSRLPSSSTRSTTGRSPSATHCSRSEPSSPARSGLTTPGVPSGAGTRRRWGRSSSGSSTPGTCTPACSGAA